MEKNLNIDIYEYIENIYWESKFYVYIYIYKEIEYSSVFYVVGPCWLSISFILLCILYS